MSTYLKSGNSSSTTFKKVIVALLYVSLLLLFLSGPLRRLAPWIKSYHKVGGFIVFSVLLVLHLWSVRKSIFLRAKQSTEKFKYGIIISLAVSIILFIITAYTRKIYPVIRDIHTIYLPIIFTILLIMHIYSVTRRTTSENVVKVRPDYKGFYPFVWITISIVTIISVIIIILQKMAS